MICHSTRDRCVGWRQLPAVSAVDVKQRNLGDDHNLEHQAAHKQDQNGSDGVNTAFMAPVCRDPLGHGIPEAQLKQRLSFRLLVQLC